MSDKDTPEDELDGDQLEEAAGGVSDWRTTGYAGTDTDGDGTIDKTCTDGPLPFNPQF